MVLVMGQKGNRKYKKFEIGSSIERHIDFG